ncbi:MAG: LemA family protein [Candidatus Zixiibacteriota bacterium]|nr:MAG: LemA family protein [candidate division Zixibacteria bacterium]
MALTRGCLFSLIALAIVAFFILLVGGYFMVTYNQLVKLDEGINGAWADVDNQLMRRNDLIPNLVETVKGYATHERELFEHIADARAKLAGAGTIPDKIKAANELSGFLGRLLMIVENYPQLKASENFIRLQDELAGTENRIAVARRRYNEIVKDYNRSIRSFPKNMIAGIFNFEPREYFEVPEEAKEVPEVDFGS